MDGSGIKTRNFAVAGHSGSGKTTLCDLILYKSKIVDRLGKVDDKTSFSDYTPDEQEKVSSIYATPLNCKWEDNDLFFIDTPGYGEFIGETTSAINACDNTLIVVDGADGLEVGSTTAWKMAKNLNKPRFFLINRLDREMADFQKVLNQIQEAYGKTVCIPITMPVGKESDFSKVVNVLSSTDIPDDIAGDVAKYKEQLMDTIAESDEELMMRYLDGEQLSEEEIANGLHQAIISGALVPVFAGDSANDIGITELLNSIVTLFPGPLAKEKLMLNDEKEIDLTGDGPGMGIVFKSIVDPYIGQLTFLKVVSGKFKSDTEVFNISKKSKERLGTISLVNGKIQTNAAEIGPGGIIGIAKLKATGIGDTLSTVNNDNIIPPIAFPKPVMSYAITAVKSGEEEKITAGLSRMAESDPTLKIERNKETRELLLLGMGDQHLNNVIKKLKETGKLEVNLNAPKVPYRETITANGNGHYRHKKQSGGHGQFAEVYLRIEPNEEGNEFANEVVGGNIPRNFIPAVEKGVNEAMERGPLAGCVVVKVKSTVYDGKHHDVDSSEMAFKIAARMAFRDAMAKANAILLEPIMSVKILIPDEYMGDISGDLNQKRGRILGMGVEDNLQIVNAEVPLAEMGRYAAELRSMTQGRGVFEMEFSRYEMVPTNIANEIIERFKKEQEEQ